MRKSVAVASISIFALSGCAAPTVWVKRGANSQDYSTDSYSCERDMRQSGYYGTGLTGAVNAATFENRCMEAHGWTRETQADADLDDRSAKETSARQGAIEACEAAGIQPSTPGYSACFFKHFQG